MATRKISGITSGKQDSLGGLDSEWIGLDRTPEPTGRIEEHSEPNNGSAKHAGFDIISPIDLTGTDDNRGDNSSEPRRRGRPKGSRNTPKTPQGNLTDHLEDLLLSVHMMGAAFLKVPELELDADEAKRLSDSVKQVAEYYPVVFNPKKLAIANLVITLGTIYGTRAVAIYKTAPKRAPATVTPIRPPAPAAQPAPQPQTPPAAKVEVPSQINPSGVDDISVM